MVRLAIVIAAALAPLAAHAQAVAPIAGWARQPGYDGPFLIRPIPAGTAPSACLTRDYHSQVVTPQMLGTAKAIVVTAEQFVAQTETKDADITAGTGLVFERSYTTDSPPMCSRASPCFTMQDKLASMNTCWWPSAASGVRGLNTATNLASDVALWDGYAATYRGASAEKPAILLSVRWDVIDWSEMQVDGFAPSMLLEAASGQGFDDFLAWLEADTSYYCTKASDCEWHDSAPGRDDRDLGVRYRDLISARGGDHNKYIYYLTRPSTAGIGGPPLQANGALTDQSDPAYRAWRLQRFKSLRAAIGRENVYVALNQKLGLQYSGPKGTHDTSGGARKSTFDYSVRGRCPTVTDFLWSGRSAKYYALPTHSATNPYQSACKYTYTTSARWNVEGTPTTEGGYTGDLYAAGQSYEDYVLSLRAIADDMIAAGVPYWVEISDGDFSYWESALTPTLEARVLESIVLDAGFVLIWGGSDRAVKFNAAEALVKGKVPYARADGHP